MAENISENEECCSCGCDCECCKEGNSDAKEAEKRGGNPVNWNMHVTDTVGSSFLGILAVLLLVFLVRSNKRNRELLLEVIELRRQP